MSPQSTRHACEFLVENEAVLFTSTDQFNTIVLVMAFAPLIVAGNHTSGNINENLLVNLGFSRKNANFVLSEVECYLFLILVLIYIRLEWKCT